MQALIAVRLKEEAKEKESRAAKARAIANAGKQKVATKPSSSTESSTSTSNEGEQTPVMVKANLKGKDLTQKGAVKATPNPHPGVKPKGTRT